MRKIIPAVLCVLLAGAAVTGVNFYQKRNISSDLADASENVIFEYTAESPQASDVVYEAVNNGPAAFVDLFSGKGELYKNEDGTYTYKGKKYKRNTYMKAILCMGIDRNDPLTEKKEDYEGGQADALFLTAQDTARNTLKIIMLPRDIITEIDIIDGEGNYLRTELSHLNAAFAFGGGMHKSAENEVKAVSHLLGGLTIDHYAAADMALLGKVNDLVGGVTVTVPGDELSKQYPEWTAGKKITLHGEEAERFIRYRDIEKDGTPVLRMDQHREYIAGFFNALKRTSKTDPNIVENIYDTCTGYMITDMDKAQILKLSLDAMKDNTFGINSITQIKGTVITEEYDEVYPDYENVYDIVLSLFYREVQ